MKCDVGVHNLLLGAASVVNLWYDVGKPIGGFLSSHNVTGNNWATSISRSPHTNKRVRGLSPSRSLTR